jgi:hypothetical protein
MVTPSDLLATYSSNHRPTVAEYKHVGYMANGWNSLRRWTGASAAIETSGIAGPSRVKDTWIPRPTAQAATSTTVDGAREPFRMFRYRYLDSRTGYVSNPSLEVGDDPVAPAVDPAKILFDASLDTLRFLIGAATAVLGPHATGLAITTTTITRDSGSFVTDGFAAGDYITLSSCEDAANNATWGPIATVAALVITLQTGSPSLTANVDDTAAQWQRSTRGRIQPSTDSKVDKIVLEATLAIYHPEAATTTFFGPDSTGLNITSDQITRSSGSWRQEGFAPGDFIELQTLETPPGPRYALYGPILAVTDLTITLAGKQATANGADTTAIWKRWTSAPTGGTAWFKAAECANTDTTVDFTLSDAALEVSYLPWDDFGHDPPPVAQNVLAYQERIWLFGQVTHAIGQAVFTINSKVVEESAPDWNAEVLGSAAGTASVQWLMRAAGTNQPAYEIDYYDVAGTQIRLKANYLEASGTKDYKIFTRANVIWVSRAGYPESFDPLAFINGPNFDDAGNLTAGIGFGSSVIFFSNTGMFRYTWDQGPLVDGFWAPLSNKAGALSQRVVLEVEGTVYSMDRRGWYSWQGVFPKLISRPLGPILSSLDFTYVDRFHACYLPDSRAVRWYVCYSGETYPKHYVQFEIDTGVWSTGQHDMGITDSRLVDQGQGQRLFLLDENGYSWWGDTGLADGCPAANSHVTATVGSTTTVVQILGGGQPTTGTGLAGMYLMRRTATGVSEARLISSNTATAITVGSAFSGAPASGDKLWVGRIPSKLKTRAFSIRDSLKFKSRNGYLTVMWKPTTSVRYLQVRVYEDYSATAKTWGPLHGTARTGYAWPGVNTAYPTSDWLIDLSYSKGVASLPIGTEWKRSLEVELEIEEPDSDFYLIALDLDGHTLEEEGL